MLHGILTSATITSGAVLAPGAATAQEATMSAYECAASALALRNVQRRTMGASGADPVAESNRRMAVLLYAAAEAGGCKGDFAGMLDEVNAALPEAQNQFATDAALVGLVEAFDRLRATVETCEAALAPQDLDRLAGLVARGEVICGWANPDG